MTTIDGAQYLSRGVARTLLLLDVGASHLFAQYRDSRQLGVAIARAQRRTGYTFTSALERDLVTGDAVEGVRVTRTS